MEGNDIEEILQLMIEKIKQEEIVYNDFLGRDLFLIVETQNDLINSLVGRYANIDYYLMKIGREDALRSEDLSNKRIALKKLQLELAMRNHDIEFKKQAIQYLSKVNKEVMKEWQIYYDLYAKLES
jgi:hypothetical protein